MIKKLLLILILFSSFIYSDSIIIEDQILTNEDTLIVNFTTDDILRFETVYLEYEGKEYKNFLFGILNNESQLKINLAKYDQGHYRVHYGDTENYFFINGEVKISYGLDEDGRIDPINLGIGIFMIFILVWLVVAILGSIK